MPQGLVLNPVGATTTFFVAAAGPRKRRNARRGCVISANILCSTSLSSVRSRLLRHCSSPGGILYAAVQSPWAATSTAPGLPPSPSSPAVAGTIATCTRRDGRPSPGDATESSGTACPGTPPSACR
eukprot:CAMPEP_0194317932 /NCGR_PEP_ID=MMETSP0171-20130528/14598_1 /TAXON_ID=218684 /ORGANISM="Corethron pennatum, Strain L29A3" /LENGTH=125 /DNA_ID=CAMNT_0039074663 /DNA_START=196 /DNA_END=570 /DNA_ORIENTATION=-